MIAINLNGEFYIIIYGMIMTGNSKEGRQLVLAGIGYYDEKDGRRRGWVGERI